MTSTDRELVLAARLGDGTALAELLARYRSHAVRWAESVARDPHLAEDIAQEALLRATARLAQLQDPARFAGWLRQAVRREALNRLRKLRRESAAPDPEPSGVADDPQAILLDRFTQSELLDKALGALGAKPRAVMRELARDAGTEELMQQFGLTRANLYNVISRARSRAGEERDRAALEAYLAERRSAGHPVAARLRQPAWKRPYSLFGLAVNEALSYEPGTALSVSETMGFSGDAFRLSVAENCHWRGISTFDWTYTAQRAMERLGRYAVCCSRKFDEPEAPERLPRMLRLIHDSIGRGLPAIVWNLSINEFGLVYGYDDQTRTLYYCGVRRRTETFPYARLFRAAEEPSLFALSIGERTAPQAGVGPLIAAILQHARGEEPPTAGFAFGLQGYRLWREALTRGTVDTLGHAYQVAILCEAREHAAAFLRMLRDRARTPTRRQGLAAAADCYERAAQALLQVYPSFPYGFGAASPADAGGSARAAESVAVACEAEREAIAIFEQIQ